MFRVFNLFVQSVFILQQFAFVSSNIIVTLMLGSDTNDSKYIEQIFRRVQKCMA